MEKKYFKVNFFLRFSITFFIFIVIWWNLFFKQGDEKETKLWILNNSAKSIFFQFAEKTGKLTWKKVKEGKKKNRKKTWNE